MTNVLHQYQLALNFREIIICSHSLAGWMASSLNLLYKPVWYGTRVRSRFSSSSHLGVICVFPAVSTATDFLISVRGISIINFASGTWGFICFPAQRAPLYRVGWRYFLSLAVLSTTAEHQKFRTSSRPGTSAATNWINVSQSLNTKELNVPNLFLFPVYRLEC